jgi:hypothetical protein
LLNYKFGDGDVVQMLARIGGLGLIVAGWCLYLAALLLPAIEIGELVIADSYWHEVMPGYRCFACTINPLNWVFAPVLLPYLLVNGLMLVSPLFLRARRSVQRVFGVWLLGGFLLTLLAPWSYGGIRAAYAGCFAWMASFAILSAGFIWRSSSMGTAEPNPPANGGRGAGSTEFTALQRGRRG